MKKITIEEWLQAEEEYYGRNRGPQPEGSVTTKQYSEMTNRPLSTCRHILHDMWEAGRMRRQKWGFHWVYFLEDGLSRGEKNSHGSKRKSYHQRTTDEYYEVLRGITK